MQVPGVGVDLPGERDLVEPGVRDPEQPAPFGRAPGTFHHGSGRPLRASRRLASRSAVDRTPSATSARTRRGVADPRWLPSRSSAARCAGVHRLRWTVSAISSVISAAECRRRARVEAGRGSGGQRDAVAHESAAAAAIVRSTTTNSDARELPLLGNEQVDRATADPGPRRTPWRRQASRPVTSGVRAAVEQRGGDRAVARVAGPPVEQDDAREEPGASGRRRHTDGRSVAPGTPSPRSAAVRITPSRAERRSASGIVRPRPRRMPGCVAGEP